MKQALLLYFLIQLTQINLFAQTAWQADGVPVCTATGDQQNPVIVPNQKGGGIIIWQDYRSGNWDLYAQRIDSLGNACWANNGVAIAASAVMENGPRAISDMRGGAIVVFNRGDYNVWAQRVDSLGNVCWGADGMGVSSFANSIQMSYNICSDSESGAYITWKNNDTLSSNGNDAYVQKIDSAANLPWGTYGVLVAGGPNDQRAVGGVIEDGEGGGVIVWDNVLPGLDFRFYASRINKDGTFKWQSTPVCTLSGEKYIWNIVTDGKKGGVAVWKDRRNANWDVYAQRVDSTGNVQWQLNGVPVCTLTTGQEEPVITGDGCGGSVITWHDYRNGYADIYAQRVDSLGNTIWQNNGVAVCNYDSTQGWPCITATDTGKSIISWFDRRAGQYHVYTQAVDGDGSLAWSVSGLAVCTVTGGQFNDIYNRKNQVITTDECGGVILVWHDGRNGNYDIYAQKLNGLTGVEGQPEEAMKTKTTNLIIWPNPFMGQASIGGAKQNTIIKVYDITGRLVEKTIGSVIGKKLGSGIYFITAENYKTIKAIKIK